MATRIQKWGNSLAVRLPKATVERFQLTQGCQVEVISGKNEISIKLTMPERVPLKEMVKKINKRNLPKETW